MPASCAPRASAVFASCDSAPNDMSETKSGMSSHNGFSAFGTDAQLGADRNVVEQRQARELRGHEVDGVPRRHRLARHAHRGDEPVMSDLGETVGREFVNAHHVGLFDRAVRIGVEPLIHVGRVRLRVPQLPAHDVVAVDEQAVVFDLRREAFERFRVVVRTDARFDSVVPAVQSADQVVPDDLAVGEQRAAVQTTSVEHRTLVVSADDDEVDTVDHGRGRHSVGHLGPGSNANAVHGPDCTHSRQRARPGSSVQFRNATDLGNDPHMSRRDELRALLANTRQYVLAAAIVGALTGFAVAGFERLTVDAVLDRVLADLPLVVLAFLPAAGLTVAALWLWGPGRGLSPATADEYLESFHEGRPLHVRELGHRLVASFATLASGCALGLEGPSIYIGSVIGNAGQRRFRRLLVGADRNLLLVAGAAAGIAAIFKAPATGAVFALEVPYHDDLARRMLLPALVASASGYVALAAVNGTAPLFPVNGSPTLSFVDLAAAAALGLAGGIGARVFAWMLQASKRVYEQSHPVVRVAGAGASIAVLFAIGRGATGENLVLSPGYGVIQWAADPRRTFGVLAAVLVLRCCATSAAVAGGGVGGLFVPLVVAGALLGRMFGEVVGHDASLFLVVGVAAFLGAGYRVPLAAVMFVAETTGRPAFIVPGVIAAVVAELMMAQSSVTTHQVEPDPNLRD